MPIRGQITLLLIRALSHVCQDHNFSLISAKNCHKQSVGITHHFAICDKIV